MTFKLKFTSVPALTLMTFIAFGASGQTTESVIQKLVDHQLLQEKNVKAFRKYLENYESQSNAAYLEGLYQAEFTKLTGAAPGWYILTTYDTTGITRDEQDRINQDLTGYILRLKDCGLINDGQLETYKRRINANEFVALPQILNFISMHVAFAEYMNHDDLKIFASRLKELSIVTTMFDDLISGIDAGAIERPIDFLKYCDKAIIVNMNEYPDDPAHYLETIHRKTAGVLAGLSFDDFSYEVVQDSSIIDSDSPTFDFLVSLNSNARRYKQRSFYRLYSPAQNKYFGVGIDPQEYYAIFNKVLADLQSQYRLHQVKAYAADAADDSTFGIIALTREQAKALHGSDAFFNPSYESFRNSITTEKIEQAVEAYKRIGLLSHLTSAQIQAARHEAASREIRSLNDLLICFPDIVHEFDAELANLNHPYAELVKAYARISHGRFNPKAVSDNFDIKKTGVMLRFSAHGKDYTKKFRVDGDWIDPEFFGFINSVVEVNNPGGKFYELYSGGQEASIIFLTESQYQVLRAGKLAIFADEWQTAEEE